MTWYEDHEERIKTFIDNIENRTVRSLSPEENLYLWVHIVTQLNAIVAAYRENNMWVKLNKKEFEQLLVVCIRCTCIPTRSQVLQDLLYIPEDNFDFYDDVSPRLIRVRDGYEILIFKDKVYWKQLAVSIPLTESLNHMMHYFIKKFRPKNDVISKVFDKQLTSNDSVMSFLESRVFHRKKTNIKSHDFRVITANAISVSVDFIESRMANLETLMRHEKQTRRQYYTYWTDWYLASGLNSGKDLWQSIPKFHFHAPNDKIHTPKINIWTGGEIDVQVDFEKKIELIQSRPNAITGLVVRAGDDYIYNDRHGRIYVGQGLLCEHIYFNKIKKKTIAYYCINCDVKYKNEVFGFAKYTDTPRMLKNSSKPEKLLRMMVGESPALERFIQLWKNLPVRPPVKKLVYVRSGNKPNVDKSHVHLYLLDISIKNPTYARSVMLGETEYKDYHVPNNSNRVLVALLTNDGENLTVGLIHGKKYFTIPQLRMEKLREVLRDVLPVYAFSEKKKYFTVNSPVIINTIYLRHKDDTIRFNHCITSTKANLNEMLDDLYFQTYNIPLHYLYG
jgi:hypothetical protein